LNVPAVFQRWRGEGALVEDLAFLVREPAGSYHAQAKHYLTSHQLGDFRRCPYLFRRKSLGLVHEEDRPAYVIGRAAHTLVLEGREAYERAFACGGPINPRTGEPFGSRTRTFRRWTDAQGRTVLDRESADLIERMNASVRGHEHAARILADGVPEGVVRADYCGMPCQARLDWLNPTRGIVDLKTADDLTWFESDARTYGYAHQVAFYRALVAQVTGRALPVYLIAVEKREPYRSGVWRIGEDVLGIAEKENAEAIERLKACREADRWPTGYEDVRTFDWI